MSSGTRKTNWKSVAALFLAVTLGVFVISADAQENTPIGKSVFIPQIGQGVKEAQSHLSEEEFTSCFTMAIWASGVLERGTLRATGQSLVEVFEKFSCDNVELKTGNRSIVTGVWALNGKSYVYSTEIIPAPTPRYGNVDALRKSFMVGLVLLDGRRWYISDSYLPAYE